MMFIQKQPSRVGCSGSRLQGFTIVEILIVIIVIAILATITIVSYNGMQNRAAEVALQNDLQDAAATLGLDNKQAGKYPASESLANGGKGLQKSPGTNFEYSYAEGDNSYCLSATSSRNGVKDFYISSENTQVVAGVCTGHTPTNISNTIATTWTARSVPANTWSTVAFGGGTFMMASSRGVDQTSVYSTSTNGQSWSTPADMGTAAMWDPKLIFTGSQFVSGFGTGRGFSMVTSNNGQTWQHNAAAGSISSYIISDIAYGAGIYVGIRNTPPTASTSLYTSTDGINWTTRDPGLAYGSWTSVTFANGKFVAVANGGTPRVMTSTNGINWTIQSVPEANAWSSVTYGNGKFVAVAISGTNRVMTSPDGVTWTARPAAEANAWKSVTYGGGKFVAVATSGTNRVMTSLDGITWTARPAAEANQWMSVAYGNGCFVAVANSGTNRVMTSCE